MCHATHDADDGRREPIANRGRTNEMIAALVTGLAEGMAAHKKPRVVSLQVARHVLFHLGDRNYGIQPGEFEQRLMLAIDAADEANRALLASVYPEHVVALRDGRKHWGLAWLQGIAREVAA